MENSNILEIKKLTKLFGGLSAVNNVSMDVKKGEIFGLIGPNGAGKTTIFNLITGIIVPTKGKIYYYDEEMCGKKPHVIAQRGIARTFQNIKLFGNLTVLQNVLTIAQVQTDYGLIAGFLRSKKCRKQEREIMEFSMDLIGRIGISKYANSRAGNLPYGVQKRVEIARALALRPKLLLLDEPGAGLNEDEAISMVKLLKDIKDEFDISLIVIDHRMDLIMSLCNKVTVLNFGQLIATGTPEEIQNNPLVIEAYLGVEER